VYLTKHGALPQVHKFLGIGNRSVSTVDEVVSSETCFCMEKLSNSNIYTYVVSFVKKTLEKMRLLCACL